MRGISGAVVLIWTLSAIAIAALGLAHAATTAFFAGAFGVAAGVAGWEVWRHAGEIREAIREWRGQ